MSGKRSRDDAEVRSCENSSSTSSDSSKHHKHHKHHHHKHKRDHEHVHEHKKKQHIGGAAVTSAQWGSHGVIQESDRWNKQPEFFAWLAEVKHVDPETLRDKRTSAELWATFVEDYNTATLPSEKYYDLAAWDRATRDSAIAGAEEEGAEDIARKDEESLRRERDARRKARSLTEMARELDVMRQDQSKLRDMEHQDELRRKQKLAWKVGDVQQAARIAERLAPSAPSSTTTASSSATRR